MQQAGNPKTAIGLALAATGALAFILGTQARSRVAEERAFVQNDAFKLTDDATGLRAAYELLRRRGYRVALQTPDGHRPPATETAWWLMQIGSDWLAEPEERAKAVRAFAEAGGTVVLAPEETLTLLPEDWSPPGAAGAEASEPIEALTRFLRALDLDVQLVAFEPPDEDEETEHEPIDDAPRDDDDDFLGDSASYTLEVSGTGSFRELGEVETSWGNYWEGEDLLKGDIRLHTDGFPLVVEFGMGKGRVVLVAESTYFENEFVARPDNSRLLAALARDYGGSGIKLFTAR